MVPFSSAGANRPSNGYSKLILSNSLGCNKGVSHATWIAARPVRGRTERPVQCGEPTPQGPAKDGQGSLNARTANGVRGPPGRDAGPGTAAREDLQETQREPERQEVQGDGRSDRGGQRSHGRGSAPCP